MSNQTLFSPSFFEPELDSLCLELLHKLNAKYEFVGAGRNRATFKLKSGNYVLKVPLNYHGGSDNNFEFKQSKNNTLFPDIVLPKTKLVEVDGFGCLIMENINIIDLAESDNLPEWTTFIDCCQVGYNKKGILMPYDYA